ncbi:MAG: type II secretion system F family protein [Planctomycetes bacterium]|nr:type II secretion system F family protein [Planctomycetota bacterium]
MKTFEYDAMDATGRAVVARATARDEVDLDRILEGRGLTLRTARPVSGARALAAGRLKQHELVLLTTQLATVTGAGVPIVEGLEGIGERFERADARAAVKALVDRLRAGESLSSAMAAQPRSFPEIYRASVLAGEASGGLEKVLLRLAHHMEWSQGVRSTTRQALVYPAILLTAVFGLVILLLTFLIPRILTLYPGGAQDLPWQTRIVMGASDFVRGNAIVLGIVLVLAVGGFVSARRRPGGRRAIDGMLLRVPRLGHLLRQIATSSFASTAATLQSAGCDVFTMLRVAGTTCGNAYMVAAFERASDSVRKGLTITAALERERACDSLLVQMVSVGEKSGDLDGCLERLVAYYDQDVPRSVKRMLALLEPMLILFAGVMVGFILLAAMLPVFDLYENLK